jgi:hypothetical protein
MVASTRLDFGPGFAEKMKARPKARELEEIFWVTGFYLSSEREPDRMGPHMERYSRIAYDILQSKGYKMLQGYDLSATFTFDSVRWRAYHWSPYESGHN